MEKRMELPQGILLTGASGFLAGDLLVRLLDLEREAKIYLLLRAANGEELAAKRQAIFARLSLDGEAAARVVAVAGDVEQPDLGLRGDYDRFAAGVSEIYHSAASTSF